MTGRAPPRTFDELKHEIAYELRWSIRLLKVAGVFASLWLLLSVAEAVVWLLG